MSQHGGRRLGVGLLVLGVLAAVIGLVPPASTEAAPPPFTTRASVNQVSAEDLTPGDAVDLLDASDAVVATLDGRRSRFGACSGRSPPARAIASARTARSPTRSR